MSSKSSQCYKRKIIKSVAKLFLNSSLDVYAHAFLNLVQSAQVLTILLGLSMLDSFKEQIAVNQSVQAIILLLLVFQALLVVMVGIMVVVQKGEDNQNVYILEYESHSIKIIQRAVGIMLLVYRKALVLPIFTFTYACFSTQSDNFASTLSIVNIILSVGILHPLSGIIFCNKITFYPNIMAYPYKVNTESLVYLYFPIHIFISIYQPTIISYLSIMFCAFCFAIMYIRPIVMYRQNKISVAGISLILSSIFLNGIYTISSIPIDSGNNIFLFILICFIFAVILYLYQMSRIRKILLSSQQSHLFSKIIRCNFNQILFYHIVNYQTSSSSLLLFLIHYNQTLNKKIISSKNKQSSEQNIFSKKQFSQERQCEHTIKKIIEELKNQNMQSKEIQRLFSLFLLSIFKSSHDPQNYLDSNLGIKQINDKISHFEGLSIITSQILMLESSDLRKCYTFMRLHEKLLQKVDSLGFLDCIEINSSIAIIEEDLKVKGKTSEAYSMKAEKYFSFEKIYESLKDNVLECCNNRLAFWREHDQKQIHCQKLKSMIHKNFALSKKIESTSSRILKQFPNKSPIILFELISSYSTEILNKKIYTNLNPFYPLVKKYKDQLQFQKKQGALMHDSSSIKNFSLLQNIGVCMIDLQQEVGQIEWANQYFWVGFYLSFALNRQNTEIQQISEENEYVFNFMVPQLKDRHLTYFKDFSSSSELNQGHDVAFLYQRSTKIFQRINIQIQIFPSLSKGLKVTTFMVKNNLWDKDNFEKSAILIKEDFSIVGFSKEFICLKSLMTQNEMDSLQIKNGDTLYLCQEIIEVENFTKLLHEELSQVKGKHSIEVKIGRQMYQITLVKVYQNQQNKKLKAFQESSSQVCKNQLTKNIYLLQITPIQERKPEQISTQTNDQKVQKSSNFLATTKAQEGYSSDLKSQYSINTSYNSCNIDRAISLVPDVEKEEAKQNDKKGQKSDQIINMEKKYKELIFSKKPKKIRCWMYFTLLMIFLLGSAMGTNIIIFSSRQSEYDEARSKVQYFYEITTDIGQIITALREYNFYVYTNGVTNPHIPYLVNQIGSEQDQVNYKLKYVASQMSEKWSAIEIKPDTGHYFVEQQDFIVITNYMLSAITYISQIEPQQMNFPIFWSQITPQIRNNVVVNYNQAVYNGIYVVLDRMNTRRQAILDGVLDNFRGFQNKYYIYPSISGIFFLLIFALVSIFLEQKSENIRLKTLDLLGKVNPLLKEEKIFRLIQFKQNNGSSLLKSTKNNNKKAFLTQMAKTVQSIGIPCEKNPNFMRMLKKGRNSQQSDLNNDENKYIEGETQNETKRDLFGNTVSDLQAAQIPEQSHKKNFKKQNQPTQEYQYSKEIILPRQKAQKFKIAFYTFVILPTLIYFIVILVGGVKIDSEMVSNFELAAEIYTRKSNEELALLMTRETFYFEPFLTFNASWTQDIMLQIERSLHHYRKLEKLIYENQNTKTLRDLVQELKNGNLCNQLHKLEKSQCYEVSFTKEECLSFQHGILTKGLKQTQTWYYSTAIFILNNFTDTSLLSHQDRIKYLQMPEFNSMKIMLAYAEQFSDMIANAFEADFENHTKKFINENLIYSVVSIFGLGLLLIAIKYRWGFVNKQRKQIISIVDLVSLESIKSHPPLTKIFKDMELNFYK